MIFFLVGMPCSGKTTFGQAFASHQKCNFLDLDAEIIRLQNQSISAIFEKIGEDGFRKIEHQTLCELDLSAPTVVATGGGTPCFYNNMEFMRTHGTVLWLDPAIEILKIRFLTDSNKRPLLQAENADFDTKIRDLYAQRKPFYEQAHYRLT